MSTETHSSNLQLEHLFKAAFQRTKSRLLSYIIGWLLFYAMLLGACLAIALVAGLHFLVFAVTKSPAVVGTLAFISSIAAIVGIAYLGSWGTLATTLILIAEKPITISDAMKEVKPIIWRYLGVSVLMTLFFVGIMSISAFTLFILMIVWMVWSAFALFIFLEEKQGGLASVWKSKAMIKGHFWAVFGRFVLIWVAMYVVMIALSFGAANYKALNLVTFILSLLVGPFAMSYMYEIYKNLPKVEKAEKSMGWIIALVVGWLLFAFWIVSIASTASKTTPRMMENVEKQMMMKKTRDI